MHPESQQLTKLRPNLSIFCLYTGATMMMASSSVLAVIGGVLAMGFITYLFQLKAPDVYMVSDTGLLPLVYACMFDPSL